MPNPKQPFCCPWIWVLSLQENTWKGENCENKAMPDANRIIQIMPAEGWQAVFHDDTGGAIYEDLACWALQEGPEGTVVQGMVTIDVPFLRSVESMSSFIGYKSPNSKTPWTKRAHDAARTAR